MRSSRGVMTLAVVVVLGLVGSAVAAATSSAKGPPAARHTRQIKGDVRAISCASRALCEGVEITPSSQWAYVRITHDGTSARMTRAKKGQTPEEVSCPSAAGCSVIAETAAFTYAEVPVSAHGAIGKPVTISPANSNDLLNSIACHPTRTHCTLVGVLDGALNVVVVTGSRVTAHQLAVPARLQGVDLLAVACPSATTCYAAGAGSINGKELGLIVPIVNGVPTSYSLVPSASYDGLSGIACATSTTCYAIGFGTNRSRVYTVRAGKVTRSVPAPKSVPLWGIACQSAHVCDAVGSAPPPKRVGNPWGAVLPIRNGRLGKIEITAVTPLYEGGDSESTEPVTGFHGGIAIIGDDLMRNHATILSIS
jgi:hypothetical protein